MIPLSQALDLVLNTAKPLNPEHIDIEQALGRVLAENVTSDIDMPPFNKALMDGYACNKSDIANPLPIVETISAGHPPTKALGPNQCSKIMTGAMLPKGANCVFMVEYSREVSSNKVLFTGKNTNDNISYQGQLVKKGEQVLKKGCLIKPQHIGVLATVGHVKPLVYRQPKVGIIATGDELVAPNEKPQISQIRDSNSLQLLAQTRQVGAIPTYYGIIKDDKKALEEEIDTALKENDLVILSGGVSMGDLDLVSDILSQKCGGLLFDRVQIKPGKPTVFGTYQNKYCFGLPGNPVSAFVIFTLLVKPFLYKLMRHDYQPSDVKMNLPTSINNKKADRERWIPVLVQDSCPIPLRYQGSSHIDALSYADGLISIPTNVQSLPKGTTVDVRSI